MIQDINHLNAKQVIDGKILNNLVSGSESQNKDVMIALSKIQLGDLLSGKLILENDQTLLKLENNLKLLVHLPNKMVSNQLLDFLVVGKSRQHLELEWVQTNHGPQKEQGIEAAVIKEMQLPNNSEMKQVIGQWMEKQLPLVKNQLLQVYHLAKNYDLPSEVAVNISAKESHLSEQEMQLVSKFKAEGIHLVDNMVEEMVSDMNHSEIVGFNLSLSQHSSSRVLKQLLTKELAELESELFIAQSNPEDGETKFKQSVEDLIEKLKVFEFGNSEQVEEQTSLLKSVFQLLSKENLKGIAKELIHKYLTVCQDDLSETKDEIEKLDEVSKRLKDIVQDVEKHAKQEITSTQLKSLDQMAQALDKYQTQGQYYYFPLQIKEHQTSGELYYFKPNKKNKKGQQDSRGMYIVLALDMPSIKHIEIHLVEQKDQLGLKIKVANDEILKQIQAHEAQLRKLMDDTMMPIGEISVERLQTSREEKNSKKEARLSRLDFRI